jgi:hypothetical protein
MPAKTTKDLTFSPALLTNAAEMFVSSVQLQKQGKWS